MGPRLIWAASLLVALVCSGCGEKEAEAPTGKTPTENAKKGEAAQGGPKLELNPDYKGN